MDFLAKVQAYVEESAKAKGVAPVMNFTRESAPSITEALSSPDFSSPDASDQDVMRDSAEPMYQLKLLQVVRLAQSVPWVPRHLRCEHTTLLRVSYLAPTKSDLS